MFAPERAIFAHLLAFARYLCIPWIHFPRGDRQSGVQFDIIANWQIHSNYSSCIWILAFVSIHACVSASAACGFAHLFALCLPWNMIKYFVMRLRNPTIHAYARHCIYPWKTDGVRGGLIETVKFALLVAQVTSRCLKTSSPQNMPCHVCVCVSGASVAQINICSKGFGVGSLGKCGSWQDTTLPRTMQCYR